MACEVMGVPGQYVIPMLVRQALPYERWEFACWLHVPRAAAEQHCDTYWWHTATEPVYRFDMGSDEPPQYWDNHVSDFIRRIEPHLPRAPEFAARWAATGIPIPLLHLTPDFDDE